MGKSRKKSREKRVKISQLTFPKPEKNFVNAYRNLTYQHVISELKKIESTKKTKPPQFEEEKKYLVQSYSSQSPDEIQIEDDDGTYFPKPIPLPSALFVQFAEPHVLITDWSEDVKSWYHFQELIQELEKQAFVSYFQGLYYACFMCSVGCLEYIMKYEYIRKTHDESILQNQTFGTMLKKLTDINLEKYREDLELVNGIRNGFFHLNTDKLKNSIVELRTKRYKNVKINTLDMGTDRLTTQTMDREYHKDTFDIPDNKDMSKISHHVYCLLNKITNELYGPKQQASFIKECIRDYETRYMG